MKILRNLGFMLCLLGCGCLDSIAQISLDEDNHPPSYVRMFRFTPDGKHLIGYTFKGSLVTWDLGTGKVLHSKPAKAASPALDASGRLLSLVNDAKGLRLVDAIANQELKVLENANFNNSLSKFDLSGDSLAFTDGTSSGLIKVWDIASAKERVSIEKADTNGMVGDIVFSPDQSVLAILSNSVSLWSTNSGKLLRLIKINGGLARMDFSPDGKKICVSGFDNIKPSFIRCFDTESGQLKLDVQADPSSPFAFNANGTVLALVRRDDEGIFLVNALTGKQNAKLTSSVDHSGITQMSYSPDGKLLAVSSTNGVIVIDVASGRERWALRADK